MGVALYRKYRSKSLSEIVGQEHITSTLDNALKKGAISHAYLFTGPRGVGKTSIARILAHQVNELAYDETANHFDIIEIDAASNRGIDEMRDLRERAIAAPANATYKIYIIDEVHMLTTPAFNSLLKILEEPPAHVIFILATTEAHKLPDTIVSRTQRFTFRPIEEKKVIAHLKTIAKSENLTVSDDALKLIAQHGGGSFRDSITLLDQASSSRQKVDEEDVLRLLGIAPAVAISELLDNIVTGDAPALLKFLRNLHERGYHAAGIATQLGQLIRSQLLQNRLAIRPVPAVNLLRQLLAVSPAHDPDALLEITLLGANLELSIGDKHTVELPGVQAQSTRLPDKPRKNTQRKSALPTKAGSSTATTTDIWVQVLDTIKNRHNTLYSVLRMAKPSIESNKLTLVFTFEFHKNKINEQANRQIISDIVRQVTGQPVIVKCTVDKSGRSAVDSASNTTKETISNIFGGAEVLE
jgi:DNA polymerase III subunit gamma/tau